MKLTRKLIPAMIMLLVSAVLMSTASFAWFAMNTAVQATGMEVSAKSNDTFLQIMDVAKGQIETDGVVATATNKKADLYPAKYQSGNFVYAYSSDQDEADRSSDYFDISADDLKDYVLTNEFKIFMKKSAANSKTVNLKVSGFTVTCANPDMLKAIRIVVTCGEKVQELSAEEATSGESKSVDGAVTLANEVTEDGVIVKIQVYIDGDYETVYSNNVNNLKDAAVSVSFSTEQPSSGN